MGRASDGQPDRRPLILSDINMPGMTGLELLPKAKTARPDVPVIMITAYGDDSTRRKALEGGAKALLTKPIDFVALRSEIDSRVAGAGAEGRGRDEDCSSPPHTFDPDVWSGLAPQVVSPSWW